MKALVLTVSLLLVMPRVASGQVYCLPGDHSVDMVKARLLDLASRRAEGIDGFVVRTVAPGPPPGCPVLRAGENVQAVLEDLIRFVAQQEDTYLSSEFFLGIGGALAERDRASLRLPIGSLAFAVESGRTPQGRAHALRTLLGLQDDVAVRGYLERWARARRGPTAWPDLPEQVVLLVYFDPSVRTAALRAALEADTSLILNPVARCLVQNRGLKRDHPPGSTQRCFDSEPQPSRLLQRILLRPRPRHTGVSAEGRWAGI